MHPLIVFGLSMYPDRQVHFAKPLFSIVHRVLGPQGDGLHKSVSTGSADIKNLINSI